MSKEHLKGWDVL
jgi:hypothetical protein